MISKEWNFQIPTPLFTTANSLTLLRPATFPRFQLLPGHTPHDTESFLSLPLPTIAPPSLSLSVPPSHSHPLQIQITANLIPSPSYCCRSADVGVLASSTLPTFAAVPYPRRVIASSTLSYNSQRCPRLSTLPQHALPCCFQALLRHLLPTPLFTSFRVAVVPARVCPSATPRESTLANPDRPSLLTCTLLSSPIRYVQAFQVFSYVAPTLWSSSTPIPLRNRTELVPSHII